MTKIVLGNGLIVTCKEEDLKEKLISLRESGTYVQAIIRE